MTTNNPEVKRYNITTDNHYHPVSYETEQGYWVKYSSYEALQAEFVIRLDELSARNYELRMGLAEKTSECEKLRKDAELWESIHDEIHRRADKEHALADRCDFDVTIMYEDYAAIDAAMAGGDQ